MRSSLRAIGLLTLLAADVGCLTTLDPCGRAAPGASLECPIDGVFDRAFSIRVPSRWDGAAALPVIVALHGGDDLRGDAPGADLPAARRPERD